MKSQLCPDSSSRHTGFCSCSGPSHLSTALIQVPPSTPLPIQLGKHVPMKKGEPLKGYLLYPVYAENRLVIPAGTVLRGNVVKLNPDRSHRIHSRLWGDFTPFHVPVVQFDQLVLPDGSLQPIVGQNATDGATVLHLSAAPSATRRSFFTQLLNRAKQQVKDTAALVTAPGRADRLVQAIYRQLPYHPERIESETAWTVSLEQPLSLRPDSFAAELGARPAKSFLVSASQYPCLARAILATTRLSRRDNKFGTKKARRHFHGCRCRTGL